MPSNPNATLPSVAPRGAASYFLGGPRTLRILEPRRCCAVCGSHVAALPDPCRVLCTTCGQVMSPEVCSAA